MRITHVQPVLRPGGGPSGYLYNLRQSCLKLNDCPVTFASQVIHDARELSAGPSQSYELLHRARHFLPKSAVVALLRAKAWIDEREALGSEWDAPLKDADAVVVHDIRYFLKYLNWRRQHGLNRQIAILMNHPPTNPSQEMVAHWATQFGLGDRIRPVQRRWEKMELDAIAAADALILPNRHAVDGYFPGEDDKRRILLDRKIFELPSGVPPLLPTHPRDEVRARLGLGPKDLAVGYLGRLVPDKGYDIFVEAAQLAASGNAFGNVRFFGVGTGHLMAADPPPNLVQLGWRTDAADLMGAFDILFVPNRIAYFDLVILEALSVGKTVYTTHVGGSKGLVQGCVKYLYSTAPHSIAEEFLNNVAHPDPLLEPEDVIRVYQANYSEEKFVERHVNLAAEIRDWAEQGRSEREV
jgi:glycosyltransferase involved in cell wall biosynthesis